MKTVCENCGREPICRNCKFYTPLELYPEYGYYCKLTNTVYDADFSCEKFQLKEKGEK
jgi:hypothetical protein